MKAFITSVALLVLIFFATNCGPAGDAGSHDHDHGGDAASGAPVAPSLEDAVTTADGVSTIRLTGDDRMRFNITEFTVKSGDTVRIELEIIGRMPKSAMGHNVVVLVSGADAYAYAAAAASARDEDYMPAALADDVLAHTKMLGPGEKDVVEFTAPEPGEYEYLCSFPGHLFGGMRGIMTVVD